MKRWLAGLAVLTMAALLTSALYAQPPGGPGGKGKGKGGKFGGPGAGKFGGKFRLPPNPLVQALDTDKDGVLSAKEIRRAAKALKKLDENGDGQLTAEELRPKRFGGKGGFPFGGPGGKFGGKGGKGGKFGGKAGNPKFFQERLKALDKNEDGKLTKKELPPFLHKLIDRFDANDDGALDENELREVRPPFRFGKGGPGGKGGKGGKGKKQPPDA